MSHFLSPELASVCIITKCDLKVLDKRLKKRKYTNAKIKKNELTKLQEKCEAANIKADIFVIFSKAGFSSELKSLKGEGLKLFTVKNFKKLLE